MGDRVRATGLLFALAVALLAGGAELRADDVTAAAPAGSRARIAILPMVVNTSGEQAYLRSGLADMLASRLGRNPELAVVRIEDEALATSDPQRAAALAIENGAQYAVFGAFTQFGEGASLDVQCLDAAAFGNDDDPRARRIFIQSGTVGEIIPQLDATAGKISLFVAGSAHVAEPELPAVAAGPAPAAPRAAANEAGLEDLRRRLETIEDFLFSGKAEEKTAEAAPEEGASPETRLR